MAEPQLRSAGRPLRGPAPKLCHLSPCRVGVHPRQKERSAMSVLPNRGCTCAQHARTGEALSRTLRPVRNGA